MPAMCCVRQHIAGVVRSLLAPVALAGCASQCTATCLWLSSHLGGLLSRGSFLVGLPGGIKGCHPCGAQKTFWGAFVSLHSMAAQDGAMWWAVPGVCEVAITVLRSV